ncbi:flagellar hook-associated protein FlgL [Paenibacillus alba]|uniref:flagellar hook-associated protein FlgL n=1 Tax=Paenibacillus alba TaxID=1197127 RepID=UPI001565B6AD|nr:flagellar hook-associated protein FlgL [Paenibacillus alba]NQX70115.1 flagellar hook-associated protein FlgL [Paenibacillus alba]
MTVRVTQSMMHSQLLRNVNNNMGRMETNQNILATGKKINKPSDDPVGITYALRYRSELSINEQYQKNVDMASSQVEHTDTILGQVGDIVQRANELVTRGLNGTNPQSALDAIAKEIGQIYEQAVTLGNDQLNGKYIFNGQKTDIQPYTSAGAATETTDSGKLISQFAAGVTIPLNVTGSEVFGQTTDSDNLFSVLKGLQTAFSAGDQATAKSLYDEFGTRITKILEVRSEVGARANRLDLINNRIKDLDLNLNSLDATTEDADMAETITKLKSDESVYQASLSVGAKIIQPSLLDYIR